MDLARDTAHRPVALGLGLVTLQRRVAKGLSLRFAEEDATMDQWCVLAAIAALSSSTMRDLARETGLPNATLTRTVDSLVNNALVFRLAGKDDRRRINVYLSDFGRQRLNRLNAMASAVEKALADEIGTPQLDDLRHSVDEAFARLDRE